MSDRSSEDTASANIGTRQRRWAGPYHGFHLLEERTHPYESYLEQARAPDDIRMSDDVIEHLYDSLEWISSVNPANPDAWRGHGLNRWGPTVISKAGAPTARRIFTAWADLFSAGPMEIELRGAWTTWPDGAQDYQRVLIPREDIVTQLRGLAEYAQRCVEGDCYIFHIGV